MSKKMTDPAPLTPIIPEGLTARVVGLGGVGGIVARYVAAFLASLDHETRLVLIDGDIFQQKNSERMLFTVPGNKAEVTREDLRRHFADSRLTLLAIDQYIDEDNIAQLLPGGDNQVILLSVDNHATRKLVSDYCEGRNGWPGVKDICLLSGGNDGVGRDAGGRLLRGSYGNCQAYIRSQGKDLSPSLTRFHPEIDHPADRLPTDKSCTEDLESIRQLLFTNLWTASSLCAAFWLYLCQQLPYSEVVFDVAEARMQPLAIPGPAQPTRRRPGESL